MSTTEMFSSKIRQAEQLLEKISEAQEQMAATIHDIKQKTSDTSTTLTQTAAWIRAEVSPSTEHAPHSNRNDQRGLGL